MGKNYQVSLEIEGPAAMFTRPDSGAAPISYPAPTYSAVKGIFEAIARFKSAYIRPVKVEICAPIKFHKYVTNYRGPLRKDNQIKTGTSYQIPATILIDVCYRIYGIVEAVAEAPYGNNHLHALQEIFMRRLEKGQCFYTPCLGWKEFIPSYIGPFRKKTKVETSINQILPSMLYSVFNKPINGNIEPEYRQNVEIREGKLKYDK
jgi:CRISPR-associated protein Cas5d